MDDDDKAQSIIDQEHVAIIGRHGARQHSPISQTTICIECEDDIPEKRQLAMPGTKLCQHCQSRAENDETMIADIQL